MPLSDSKSATPSQRSHLTTTSSLKDTLWRSRAPPIHTHLISRHSASNTGSTLLTRTHGRQTPQEELRAPSRPSTTRSGNLRPPPTQPSSPRPLSSVTPRPYITASLRPSSTMDYRVSAQSPRLSVLERAQEAKREEEALLTRAARRESLAHRLASARNGADGALALAAESPTRCTAVPGRYSGKDLSAQRLLQHDVEYQSASADMLAAVLQERHNMDPRRVARALRIWDAVIKCLDEISISVDVTPGSMLPGSGTGLGCNGVNEKSSPSSPVSSAMRPKQHEGSRASGNAAEIKYPCPFRKRNPVRFNMREHESCVQTPFSWTGLRNHIVSHHEQKVRPRQCHRCKVQFQSDMTLLDHLMLPKDQICDVDLSKGDYDQEDGISPEIKHVLLDPQRAEDSWTWEALWKLLFPCDTDIPEPDLHPIVDLFEVDHAFDAEEEHLKKNLRDTLRLLLPEAGIEDEYCWFLAGQLDLVFQAHRANVMRQCLDLCNSSFGTAAPPLPSSASDCTTTGSDSDRQSYSSLRRGSKRRSARLSFMSPSSPRKSGGIKTLKAFACTDPKRRPADNSVGHPQDKEASTAASSPTLIDGSPPTGDPRNMTRDSVSRESLDSAIGMAGNSCDLCNQDPCRCREVIMSCIDVSPIRPSSSAFEEDRHGYWRNKELLEQQEHQPQHSMETQPARTLRRKGQVIGPDKALAHQQQELVLEQKFDALGISNPGMRSNPMKKDEARSNDNGGRLTPIHKVKDMNEEGDHTGHSPQSFKERLMRERHFSYARGT